VKARINPRINHPIIVAGIGVLAVIAAIAFSNGPWTSKPAPEDPGVATPAAPAAPHGVAPHGVQPSPSAAVPPSFDVVRVNPEGDAVIAGRAAPQSQVRILVDGQEMARLTADSRGEWVFVPETPLLPGTRRLMLEMLVPGGSPVPSTDEVVLILPERGGTPDGRQPAAPSQAMALRLPRDGVGGATILEQPGMASEAIALSIDAINYDDGERISISGRSPRESTVLVYLDNTLLGRVITGSDGHWRLDLVRSLAQDEFTVRADRIGSDGKVLARVEVPFAPERSASYSGGDDQIVVQPGQSLWRIARKAYGSGRTYTIIYDANRNQIRDPDLIYPGQVLALPAARH
jgi:nucleoid-associated protein YgaU